MPDNTDILCEIRDLLRVIAEPGVAKRDERLRIALLAIVGKSKQRAAAVLLMDGCRSQAEIRKECEIDTGNLSRVVKALRAASLVGHDEKHPKLVIPLPANFFDEDSKDNE